MTYEQIIPWLISIVSIAVAVHFGSISSKRADRDDITEGATTTATLMIKLDAIANDVKEIKSDNKKMQSDLSEFRERLATNEASIKSFHKRLDTVEGHMNIKYEGSHHSSIPEA